MCQGKRGLEQQTHKKEPGYEDTKKGSEDIGTSNPAGHVNMNILCLRILVNFSKFPFSVLSQFESGFCHIKSPY